MAISINFPTKVITVPQSYCTPLGGARYEFDVDAFRLDVKALEADATGIVYDDTHNHNTAATLAGVTYARQFEIINGYTINFEDTGSPWTAVCVGANHNVSDAKTVDHVSLIIGNSAGLIQVETGGATIPNLLNTETGDIIIPLS